MLGLLAPAILDDVKLEIGLRYTVTVGSSYQIPFWSDGKFDCVIDWGDGSTDKVKAWDDPATLHLYTPGTYEIIVYNKVGSFSYANAGDPLTVVGVSEIHSDVMGMTDISSMFYECGNIVSSLPDMTGCTLATKMQGIFRDCESMTGEVADLPVFPSMISTQGAFFRCESLTGTPTPTPSRFPALQTGTTTFQFCTNLTGAVDVTTMPELKTALSMFRSCPGLTGPVNMAGLSDLVSVASMFNASTSLAGDVDLTGCSAMASCASMFFNTRISSVTGFETCVGVTSMSAMFQKCNLLTVQPPLTNLPNCTTVYRAFRETGLTSADLTGIPIATNAGDIYEVCPSLTSLTTGLVPEVIDWTDSLTTSDVAAADVDAWLIAIDAAGKTNGTLSYSPMNSNQHLDSARSGAALTAIDNLVNSKGWTRPGTY